MTWQYILGWLLVVATLACAAAETAAHGMAQDSGWFMSAYDVWFALSPHGLDVARAAVERHTMAWIWDPVLVTALSLPAWLLFGGPGGALIWRYHPMRETETEIDEDSFFLFDRLDERAREEGEGDDPPNMTSIPPRFQELHEEGDEHGDVLPGPFRPLDWPSPDDNDNRDDDKDDVDKDDAQKQTPP